MDEKERLYGERYPIDEDFLAALGADAAGQRRGAGLRPAGDAGDRRARASSDVLWTPVPSRHRQAHERPMTPRPSAAAASAGRRRPDRARARRRSWRAVAARYAVAITPALAELIDPADPADPIARQFVPDEAELAAAPGERADPIGDDAHSPVAGHRAPLSRPRAAEGHPRLRGLLPLLLPPRDGRARQGAARCRRPSSDAALAYIAARSGDLGGDPHRRRSADAVAAPAAAS